MEKPGVEPAIPDLQGIALIHYTTGACWFIGKYGLSNAISEDPNEVKEFCGVS